MDSAIDIAALREDYVTRGLHRADLDPDPFKQFARWFGDAAAADIRDVNAMSLATVARDGTPRSGSSCLKASASADLFSLRITKARRAGKSPRTRASG